MTLIRYVGIDFVSGFEGAFELRGRVHMQANFVPGRIVHRVKLPLNLQPIPSTALEPGVAISPAE